MANRKDPFRHTKIEKTSDHTFNVHSADGGHFECQSKEKLSSLKTLNHVKSDVGIFHGIGEKKPLVCDSCQKTVAKLKGFFNKEQNKFLYLCPNCK
jgi:hypothetical protein